MKTQIKAIIILFAIFLFAGCKKDFLNVEPTNSLTLGSFFRNRADAEQAISTAYVSLRYISNYAKLTDGTSDDDIIYNDTGLELSKWIINTDGNVIDGLWQNAYGGIFRANLVLQNVPAISMDDAEKNRILGEAMFLRSFYYWQLSALFGDVPLITVGDATDVSRSALPKSPVADIYKQMISDLTQAITLLPPSYTGADIGRVTKGAAQALLGKVYLYSKDYPNAETNLNMVITSGQYKLLAKFSDLLITDNNTESILEIEFSDIVGQGHSMINRDLPQGQGGNSNLLPTQSLVNEFEIYAGPNAINGRDPRLFYSIFQNGDPFDAVSPLFKSSWTPTGYARKKGMLPIIRGTNGNNGRNWPLIRLADVLLLYAEAANENNKPAAAIAAINTVRTRVGMPNLPTAQYPVSNKQEIFKAIFHERRVELEFEWHRMLDLRRWGLAAQVLGPIGFESPKHNYFPIPQQELANNPQLVQNPLY